MMPACPGLAADDEAIWPSEIRRIDRESQDFERLPDRVPEAIAAGPPGRFRLRGFVRIHDAVSFTYARKRYRLAGVDPLPADAVCEEPGGIRRACGVQARASFARLIGAPGVSCHPADGEEGQGETLVACERNGADIAGLLVEQGFAFARPPAE